MLALFFGTVKYVQNMFELKTRNSTSSRNVPMAPHSAGASNIFQLHRPSQLAELRWSSWQRPYSRSPHRYQIPSCLLVYLPLNLVTFQGLGLTMPVVKGTYLIALVESSVFESIVPFLKTGEPRFWLGKLPFFLASLHFFRL